MFRLLPASEKNLARALDRSRTAQLTYSAVGATRNSEFPQGFQHDRHELRLGDASTFDRARLGLSSWQAHLQAGAKVLPVDAIAEGDTVLVLIGFGPLQMVAPCRIVYVIDEPNRFGLAYGTLPGHPECGEESFIVERERGGTWFRLAAFSRPAQFLTRLGAPVGRRVQLGFTDKYLQGLGRYVADGAAVQ